ncbi:MAG: helix-turn-helix transcriptional regulator [Candidatus Hydrogenedentes bacterium]|nr:helix-turn-helix transcriptional regulator [Candidatus Hydrogenedentota bacterium]
MGKIEKDMLRGHLEGLVLSVLERGDGHGYMILNRLRELSAGTLQLREGSLYPALYRLEESGLVRARWDTSGSEERPGPRRRTYSLTRRGKKTLSERRQAWEQFAQVVGTILEPAP